VYEHELVADVVETLSALVGDHTVGGVEIAVGPGVDVASAASEWFGLTLGTALEGVHVTWERAVDLLRCDDCGHQFEGSALDNMCPYCGADGVIIAAASPISLGNWILTRPEGSASTAEAGGPSPARASR
jgi:Zn finger protein HypA/HybF involved in hydrogenase expression